MNNTFSSEWTNKLPTRRHFEMYWMQLKIMEGLIQKSDRLVEMGVGNAFTYNYLKNNGYQIQSIDIDKDKNPDILCDLNQWTPNKPVDGFLSFQVFEHVPFSDFEMFIKKLASLKIKHLYVSVPYNYMSKKKLFEAKFKLPFIDEKYTLVSWPPFLSVPPRTKHHFWEIGDGSVSLKSYTEAYTNNGYKVIKSQKLYYAQYNVFELKQ